MVSLTPDLRLMWAPAETYRTIAATPGSARRPAWTRALARAGAPALIVGITTAVAATERITWTLALSGAACWSFVSLVQILTAATVIAPSRRHVEMSRAMELFFLGHAPWSLWLLAAAAFLVAAPAGARRQDFVLLTALLPLIWTPLLIFAFFRHVLHLAPGLAIKRTAFHQSLTYLVIVLYIGWAVQLWPRIISLRTP